MQLPLEVTFRGMDQSDAIEADIRRQAEKLERRFGRIMSCRVVIEAPHKHSRKGRLYRVSVDLKIPGHEIAVTNAGPENHAHEDMHVAIRDVFDAALRRLQDFARRGQGSVKTKETPLHGRIVRLFADEGYGFIGASDGGEVYFHRNAVADGRFESLKTDDEVRFVIAENEGEKGLQASTVKLIGKHHLADRT